MQDRRNELLKDITTPDRMILEEMREKMFKRILAGLAVASLAGGLIALLLSGVSSPWFLYPVILLFGLGLVYLLQAAGLFVVAAYLLLVELIGFVAGLFLQSTPIADFIPYLFIPIVIIAGLIISPMAASVTATGAILVTLVVAVATAAQLTWSNLVVLLPPFGLIILTAYLATEGGRYVKILGSNLLKTKETLRAQHWEILEALNESKSFQQRAAKLEQQLLKIQARNGSSRSASAQKERFHHLVKGAIQELKALANDLEQFVEKLNHQSFFDGQSELLEEAWHKLDHLTNLIVNLEEMAYLESDRMLLKHQSIDVASLLREITGTAQGLARGKNIELRHRVPDGLPKLYADPYRLRQALLHILSNAVKYTDEGMIEVKADVTDSDLVISISDTGIGIDKKDQEKIFQTFGRASNPQAISRQGTGLGLALSEQIAKVHGGRIWVSSLLGVGSTFCLALPLASPLPETASAASPAQSATMAETVLTAPLPDRTPEELPTLIRPAENGLTPPIKHKLGPVARFSPTYIGRFGLTLIGLLLLIGLTVTVLAFLNVVGEEANGVIPESTALSNEIAGLPTNTIRPNSTGTGSPRNSATDAASATPLLIHQFPATSTSSPTPFPTPTSTNSPVPEPTLSATPPPPTATATLTPIPTVTARPTVTALPSPTSTPSLSPTPPPPVSPPASATDSGPTLSSPASGSGGQQLSFAAEGGVIQTIARLNGGEKATPETRVAVDLIDYTGLSWSPGGQLLFASDRDGNREIYVVEAAGSRPLRLTQADGDDIQPAWSPDGSRIAFSSGRTGNLEIYVMEPDGRNPVQLTDSRGFDEWPAWSPDGRKIAFVSDRDGNVEIYTMNVDGSDQQRLTHNPAEDWPATWSPDGRRLVFASNRDSNWNLYLIDTAGGQPVRLTNDPANERDPVWSPDGRTIAFAYDGGGNWDIYTLPITSGQPAEVARPDWSRLTTTPTDERYPAWLP